MHIILSCASITCCNIHICRIVSCLQMRVNKVKFFTDFQLLSHKSVNNQSVTFHRVSDGWVSCVFCAEHQSSVSTLRLSAVNTLPPLPNHMTSEAIISAARHKKLRPCGSITHMFVQNNVLYSHSWAEEESSCASALISTDDMWAFFVLVHFAFLDTAAVDLKWSNEEVALSMHYEV